MIHDMICHMIPGVREKPSNLIETLREYVTFHTFLILIKLILVALSQTRREIGCPLVVGFIHEALRFAGGFGRFASRAASAARFARSQIVNEQNAND